MHARSSILFLLFIMLLVGAQTACAQQQDSGSTPPETPAPNQDEELSEVLGCEIDIAVGTVPIADLLTDRAIQRGYKEGESGDGTFSTRVDDGPPPISSSTPTPSSLDVSNLTTADVLNTFFVEHLKPVVLIVNVTTGHKFSSSFRFSDVSFRTFTEERRGFQRTVLPQLLANTSFHFIQIDSHAFGIELPPTEEYSIVVDEEVQLAIDPSAFIVPRVCEGETVVATPFSSFVIRATETPSFLANAVATASAATVPFVVTAMLGVPVTDVQLLAVLGSSPCARPESRAVGRELLWFITPFFEYGTELVIAGNFAVILAFFMCHYFAYRLGVLTHKRSADPHAAGATLTMFPSVSFIIMNFFACGVYYAGIYCAANLNNKDQSPYVSIAPTIIIQPSPGVRGSVGIASVLIGVVIFPFVMFRLMRRVRSKHKMSYEVYASFASSARLLRWILLPRGTWLPIDLVRRYGQLFCRFTPQAVLWMYFHLGMLAVVSLVALLDFSSSLDRCANQHIALAAIFFAAAIFLAFFRPYNSSSFTVLGSVGYLLFSVVLVFDSLLLRADSNTLLPQKAIMFFILIGFLSFRAVLDLMLRAVEAFWWRPHLEESMREVKKSDALTAAAVGLPSSRLDGALLWGDTDSSNSGCSDADATAVAAAAARVQEAVDDAKLFTALLLQDGDEKKKKKSASKPNNPNKMNVVDVVDDNKKSQKRAPKPQRRKNRGVIIEEHPDAVVYGGARNSFLAPHPGAGMFPESEGDQELQRRVAEREGGWRHHQHQSTSGGCGGGFQTSRRNPSYNVLRDLTPFEALEREMDDAL